MHVLIATDGSDQARHAAAVAHRLLPPDIVFTLVSVVAPPYDPNDDTTGFAGPLMSHAQAAHEHAGEVVAAGGALAATARELGPEPLRQLIAEGDVAEQIAAVAAEVGAEVVVIGNVVGTGLHRPVGSTIAERLLVVAPCPVLLVPG